MIIGTTTHSCDNFNFVISYLKKKLYQVKYKVNNRYDTSTNTEKRIFSISYVVT